MPEIILTSTYYLKCTVAHQSPVIIRHIHVDVGRMMQVDACKLTCGMRLNNQQTS